MIDSISKILKVFSENNLFEEGVELIGSWCFYLYQKHLGVEKFPLRTQDVDFLIPNPFRGQEHDQFIQKLESLGFTRDFCSDGSVYLWNAELKIEFLTQDKGEGAQESIRIKKLGLNAIPLRFMGLLLEDSIFVVDENVKIRLPHPKNFCLHKLLVASRRRNEAKRLKDLQHAVCVFKSLDRDELTRSFHSLPKGWRTKVINTVENNLQVLPLYFSEMEELLSTLQK